MGPAEGSGRSKKETGSRAECLGILPGSVVFGFEFAHPWMNPGRLACFICALLTGTDLNLNLLATVPR